MVRSLVTVESSGGQSGGFNLVENSLKLLKAVSLQGPRANEKEYCKSSRVENVDAPGVEEEDIPEEGETRATENAHKALKIKSQMEAALQCNQRLYYRANVFF